MVNDTFVVIDNGSGFLKAGVVGSENPVIYSNVVGKHKNSVMAAMLGNRNFVGDNAQSRRGILNLVNPIQKSIIQNWDYMEEIWEDCFQNQLQIDSKDCNLLLTDTFRCSKSDRDKITQIMFEKFNVNSLSIQNTALLGLNALSYCNTGIVLDIGYGCTSAVPIIDNNIKFDCINSEDYGGSHITDNLLKILSEPGHNFNPNSDDKFIIPLVMKELFSYIAFDFEKEMNIDISSIAKQYELTSSQIIHIDKGRFRCTEVLFQPSLFDIKGEGIHNMIQKSIMKCCTNIQDDLFNNITLIGGSTAIPGLDERLIKELKILNPNVANIRIQQIPSRQRQQAVWLGGVNLISSPNFHSKFISKNTSCE